MAKQGPGKKAKGRGSKRPGNPQLVDLTAAPPDDAKNALRNRALLSVYHYGRKGAGVLKGRPTPLTILQLHRAVTALIEPLGKEALPAIRLALADLCRTRPARGDSQIDREIERLATAFSKVNDNTEDHQHAEVARSFASIFEEPEATGDRAYTIALHRMLEHAGDARTASFAEMSWEISQK
jgi:hypothetical protein